MTDATPREEHASRIIGSGRREQATDPDGNETPHVTENDRGAPAQQREGRAPTAPVLPANASGQDKTTVAEQDQPIDEASMYDRRPEQDKDRPPSERD